jgi:nucleotide-binding universal stress UspA family protein
MDDIKTILLTTDFSDTSKQAFEPALTIAAKFGAKLVVACVAERHDFSPIGDHVAVNLDLENIWEDHHARCVARLARLVEEHFAGRVEVDSAVPRGIPHDEIVRLAKERNADLIVMATHGRGFISHAIMGSTTERVLRRAPCPVLSVRATEAADGGN